MRVIAGSLKGRNFQSPRGNRTHPMSEKIRGALFNMLGDISGFSVLDAFAGSGALSIEAISRGASRAVAVDIDKNAVITIKANAKSLGIEDKVKAIRASISGWSENNIDKEFDLVFVAPPYDDLKVPLIQKTIKHLSDNGLMVLDCPGKLERPSLKKVNFIATKNYGDAQLIYYKKNKA